MTDKPNNPQAYPHGNMTHGGELGMTMRQAYKIAALQGMLAHSTRYKPRTEIIGRHWHDAISIEAGDIADAMLAEDAQHAKESK